PRHPTDRRPSRRADAPTPRHRHRRASRGCARTRAAPAGTARGRCPGCLPCDDGTGVGAAIAYLIAGYAGGVATTETGRLIAERYEMGPLLGRGGMAEVYAATDRRLGRDVAVKLLHPAMAGRPHIRPRLAPQARAAA